MGRLQTELDAKQVEFERAVRKIDSVNRVLAKRDLEPLKLMTLEEWQAQQEGASGSASLAGLGSVGLIMGF